MCWIRLDSKKITEAEPFGPGIAYPVRDHWLMRHENHSQLRAYPSESGGGPASNADDEAIVQ